MDYPEDVPEPRSEHHVIVVEILTRLQELDELIPGDENLNPAGVRLVHRLSTLERKSRRAYRLLLDMLGEQKSFSESLEKLASRHLNSSHTPTSRQSWLQNAQADVELISSIWSEVGETMSELLKRRTPPSTPPST